MKNFIRKNKKFLQPFSLAAAGAGFLYSLTLILFKLQAVSAIHYVAFVRDFPGSIAKYSIIAAGAAAALLFTIPWHRDEWLRRLDALECAFRPSLLLWFIPCDRFPGVLLAILVISGTVFLLFRKIQFKIPELPEKYGWIIAFAGTFLISAWGYYLQIHAFNTQHFIWGDWNQYVEHYQLLLSGDASFCQWFAGAGHWNPAVNLIMSGVLKLWFAADAVFVINSLCIASIVPAGYWLSRKCGLSVWTGLIFLPLTVLNPVLSNQYLSLFYGFHPIVFFVPLLMGFFIAREYNCRWMMAVIFVLSLLVQETVCVFWAGYAFHLFFCRKWKTGIALFAGMVILFFFFSSVVIPAAHSTENYSQMFHYSQLGDSIGEVILSPFTRPAVFWGTIFEHSSLCFFLALFVPLCWGVIFKPLMMVALLPIFCGVILQSSPDIKSVMLQYGLECTVFSMIVMVLNWKQIKPEWRQASAFAVLTATFLCGWLLGMIPGNKGMADNILHLKNQNALVKFFDKAAGLSDRIIATGRLRTQFQFIRPTASIKSAYRSGDAVLLDLHDSIIDPEFEVMELRRKLISDKHAVPVTYAEHQNHTIVMFRILPEEINRPPVPWLRIIPENIFAKAGVLIHKEKDEYELRYVRINGKNIFRCRLNKAIDNDLEFRISLSNKKRISDALILFGHGLFPAYSMPPGTMFEFTVSSDETVTNINAYVHKLQ